ncbi:hypothetical protein LEMLEM_LOCUS5959 [Lemmus lemmus]
MWPCLPIFPPQPCLSQGWHRIHVCSPATLTTVTLVTLSPFISTRKLFAQIS